MTIRATIIQALDGSGMSARKLSIAAGVPYSSVQEYLTGKHDLSSESVDKILATLSISLRQSRRKQAKSAAIPATE